MKYEALGGLRGRNSVLGRRASCLREGGRGAGQGWLRVGHCHAHDKDPYWRALREFTRIEMLSNSPLLQVRSAVCSLGSRV